MGLATMVLEQSRERAPSISILKSTAMCGSPRIYGWLLVGMAKRSRSWTNLFTTDPKLKKNNRPQNPKQSTDLQHQKNKILPKKFLKQKNTSTDSKNPPPTPNIKYAAIADRSDGVSFRYFVCVWFFLKKNHFSEKINKSFCLLLFICSFCFSFSPLPGPPRHFSSLPKTSLFPEQKSPFLGTILGERRKKERRKERRKEGKKERRTRREKHVPFHNRMHKTFLLIACVETPHFDQRKFEECRVNC